LNSNLSIIFQKINSTKITQKTIMQELLDYGVHQII
jgi:hypothetical protein